MGCVQENNRSGKQCHSGTNGRDGHMMRTNEEQKIHTSVLLQEVLDILDPQPGQHIVDGTANGGGHTFALLEKVLPDGKILAIDKDEELIGKLKEHPSFCPSVIAVADSYANMAGGLAENPFWPGACVLL